MSARTPRRRPRRRAALLFFGTWLALTILHQMQRMRRLTGTIDQLGFLLPVWTFFGPIPGTLDSELLYRYAADSGPTSEWTHFPLYQPRRTFHVAIHLNRRREKTAFDAASDIFRAIQDGKSEDEIITSAAYLVLLGMLLSSTTPAPRSRFIQFMVVNSSSADENDYGMVPIFVSAMHRIPADAATSAPPVTIGAHSE